MGNFVSSFKIDEKTVKISSQPAKQLGENASEEDIVKDIRQNNAYTIGAAALAGLIPDKILEISGNTKAVGSEESKSFSLKGTTPYRTLMSEGKISEIEIGNRKYALDKPLEIKIKDGKIEKSSLKQIEELVENGSVKQIKLSEPMKWFEPPIKLHPLQGDTKLEPSLDKMEAAVRVAKNGDTALEQVAKLTADSQGTSTSIPAKPSSKGSAIG